ncbi:MAG: APC family permease [Planctomycetota bacterium]|jgi:APA family basic amino acid/polyamine antiporter
MPSPTPRPLSLLDATLLVMGGIIGVGVFFKPHQVAQLVPDPGAYFAAWILGGLAALAGAMTFAELMGSIPRTGGWFVFLREAFGRLPAFLFGWMVLVVVATGACAGVADFCIQQLQAAVDPDGSWPAALERALASGLILTITLIACFGLKSGAVFQGLIMAIKLAAIGALVLLGLVLVGQPELSPEALAASARPVADAPGLWSGLIRASLPVLFTYGGWQLLSYVAPSVVDPGRTLPRAILLGMGGVVVVYLLVNAAFVKVLGMNALAALENAPRELSVALLGEQGGRILAAGMALSALGFLVATLITTPGVYQAMAKERLFFRWAGATHARTGAPVGALLAQATMTIVYVLLHSDTIGQLGDSVVFAEWIFHFLCAAALLSLRRRRPDLPRPFRSPLYPLFPLLYAALSIAVVLGNLVNSSIETTGLGLGVLLAGLIAFQFLPRAAGSGAHDDAAQEPTAVTPTSQLESDHRSPHR